VIGGLPYGVLVLLTIEVRVDDQRHPVARDDVVDVRTICSQLDEPLAGRNQDATEEFRIRKMVRLALMLGDGEA
jgi:hypothetical protein